MKLPHPAPPMKLPLWIPAVAAAVFLSFLAIPGVAASPAGLPLGDGSGGAQVCAAGWARTLLRALTLELADTFSVSASGGHAPRRGAARDDEDDAPRHGGHGHVNLMHDITVKVGEVHEEDVVSTGGKVIIHGEVRGDVVVLDGTLDIDGKVGGDTVAILSDARLARTAHLDGDFVTIGCTVDADPEAVVRGERVQLDLSGLALGSAAKSAAGGVLRLIYIVKLLFFALLFWAMLIAVCVIPRQVMGAGQALEQIWGRAIFMGLLGYAAYALLFGIFSLLSLILIGLPLLALLVVSWFAVKAIGMAAILWLVGDRVSRNVLRRDAVPLVAFLIGFLIFLPTQVMPLQLGVLWLVLGLLGSLLNTCLSVLAIGLVLVSQVGRVTQFPFVRPVPAGPEPPPPAPSPSGAA